MSRHTLAAAIATALTALASAHVVAEETNRFDSLVQRAQRVADVIEIERLKSVYGYQQDKSLFSEQVDLFAKEGAYAIFQNGKYREHDGLRRLWYGHWSRLTADTLMHLDGFLNDHFIVQPVITVAPDGKSAKARFRARDYVFNYTAPFPLPPQHKTAADAQDHYTEDGKIKGAGPLNLIQDLIYENEYVREDGVWKMKGLTICIYANGTYGRGYADLPVPGQMGNPPWAKPGDRYTIDLTDTQPERSKELFPGNPVGPNEVISKEDLGCYIAKSHVMSRSAVYPFHYVNPVTQQPVLWKNDP
jgi:hypothetical protein